MFGEDYAYAVARIRVLETSLRKAGEMVILRQEQMRSFPGKGRRYGRSWILW